MQFDNLSQEELSVIKVRCDNSLLYFTRFFFRVLRGSKFILNWHHELICKELENAAKYKYEFLNINIPPRFSKTELVGINFIAWILSKNPKANFLYITASDELRSETSTRIRDIITHPVFFQLYGIKIKRDQSGKNLWRTNFGGGLKTATIFGQIIGFELTDYIKLFEGSIILDDINKIIDTEMDNALNQKANKTIFTTILSRKNTQETPFINIQQRAGINDAAAVLMEFFKDEKIKNIILPVISKGKPLWEWKLNKEKIEKLRTSPFTSRIFETQYMQNPQEDEGNKFKSEWFEIINKTSVPNAVKWQMFIDGAYTKSTANDPTGLMICGKYKEILYIKISIDKYLEMPELLKFIDNFSTANDFRKEYSVYIEPKASGITLAQLLNKKGYNAIKIKHKYVNKSKEERADACRFNFICYN